MFITETVSTANIVLALTGSLVGGVIWSIIQGWLVNRKAVRDSYKLLNQHGYTMFTMIGFTRDGQYTATAHGLLQDLKENRKEGKANKDAFLWSKLLEYSSKSIASCILVEKESKKVIGKVNLPNNRLSPVSIHLISETINQGDE